MFLTCFSRFIAHNNVLEYKYNSSVYIQPGIQHFLHFSFPNRREIHILIFPVSYELCDIINAQLYCIQFEHRVFYFVFSHGSCCNLVGLLFSCTAISIECGSQHTELWIKVLLYIMLEKKYLQRPWKFNICCYLHCIPRVKWNLWMWIRCYWIKLPKDRKICSWNKESEN